MSSALNSSIYRPLPHTDLNIFNTNKTTTSFFDHVIFFKLFVFFFESFSACVGRWSQFPQMENMDSNDQRPISGRGLGKQMMSTRLAPTSDVLQQISQTHVPSSQRPASTQSSQPVTGVQIHACRTGTVTQNIKWYDKRDKMRLERPDVAFEVAKDIPGSGGAKRFTFFASSEEFFKWAAHLHQRCFYEILADQQPVVLYFDVEHYTKGVDSDDMLQQTIDAIQMQLQKEWAEVRPEDLQPVVMTASRPSLGRFKHSFHLLFRNIGFSCNHGILKEWVEKIALLPELQGLNRKGVASSVIDTKVYSRNQVFRLVESWKSHDNPDASMALEFTAPAREHTLANLMASVVTNTEAVRVWIPEDITLPIGSSLDHSACSHPDRKGKSKRRADADCSTPHNSQLPNECIQDLQKMIEEQGIRGCRVTGRVTFNSNGWISLSLKNTGLRTCMFGK